MTDLDLLIRLNDLLAHLAAEHPLRCSISNSIKHNLMWQQWPLLLRMLAYRASDQIVPLVSHIQHLRPKGWPEILRQAEQINPISGFIWDVQAKAAARQAWPDAHLDVKLCPPRESDIVISIDGRQVVIEASILGESVDDRNYWDEVHAKAETDRAAGLPNHWSMRGRDGYANIKRLTGKVRDKVASKNNPIKTVFPADSINLIALNCPASLSARPHDPDMIWALDGLFSEAPWLERSIAGVPTVWSALEHGMEEHLPELPTGVDSSDFMMRHLWPAFCRLSGMLLFRDGVFAMARINYHAHAANRMSHAIMAQVELAFASFDPYPFRASTGANDDLVAS